MSKKLPTLAVLGAALLPALHAASAHAASRVWVTKPGTDSASCGDLSLPCSTFNQAHANVAAGGEISVLSPGDYGPVTITKSVSITNDGSGEAGVTGGGIVVQAHAGDMVGLRGLIIDGLAIGGVGVAFLTGSALHVQNCVIRNMETPGFFGNWGLLFLPTGPSRLFMEDSLIYNNGSSANTGGMLILPSGSGSADVVIDRVHLENNVIGLKVDGSSGTGTGAHVIVRDSMVSGNASHGIWATTAANHPGALLVVKNTTVVSNVGTGILADAGHATMLLANNTVTRNGTGVSAVNGGALYSYGNNNIDNNAGADINGSLFAKTLN